MGWTRSSSYRMALATRHKVTSREESGISGGHDRVTEQIEGEERFARVRRHKQALKRLLSMPAQVPSEPIRRPTKPSAPGVLSDGECARQYGEKCGHAEVLRYLAQPRGCVRSNDTTATEDADEEPLLHPRFGHTEPEEQLLQREAVGTGPEHRAGEQPEDASRIDVKCTEVNRPERLEPERQRIQGHCHKRECPWAAETADS